MTEDLDFEGTAITVIERDGERWLTARDIAAALGFTDPRAVLKLVDRNASEFSDDMQTLINLMTVSTADDGRGAGERQVRVFSLHGARLIALFARTERAAAFRAWVLKLIDRESRRVHGAADAARGVEGPGPRLVTPMPRHERVRTTSRLLYWQAKLWEAQQQLAHLGVPAPAAVPVPSAEPDAELAGLVRRWLDAQQAWENTIDRVRIAGDWAAREAMGEARRALEAYTPRTLAGWAVRLVALKWEQIVYDHPHAPAPVRHADEMARQCADVILTAVQGAEGRA